MSYTKQGNTVFPPVVQKILLFTLLISFLAIFGYALYMLHYQLWRQSDDSVIHQVTNSEYPQCVAEKLRTRSINLRKSGLVDITQELIDSAIADCSPNKPKSKPTVNDRLKEIAEKKSGQGQLNDLKSF